MSSLPSLLITKQQLRNIFIVLFILHNCICRYYIISTVASDFIFIKKIAFYSCLDLIETEVPTLSVLWCSGSKSLPLATPCSLTGGLCQKAERDIRVEIVTLSLDGVQPIQSIFKLLVFLSAWLLCKIQILYILYTLYQSKKRITYICSCTLKLSILFWNCNCKIFRIYFP